MTKKAFPIQAEWGTRSDHGRFPATSIPWEMIAPHEAQALANHGGQSLDRLAERGGLGRSEAVAVLEDRPFRALGVSEADRRLWELCDQSATKAAQMTNPSKP